MKITVLHYFFSIFILSYVPTKFILHLLLFNLLCYEHSNFGFKYLNILLATVREKQERGDRKSEKKTA